MQKNFGNLPEEILNKICTYVYADRIFYNIQQCELVCKNWKFPAQRSLYSNIILQNPEAVEAMKVAMKGVPTSSCPGRFTQSLEYYGRCEVNGGNGTSWVNLFIDVFPNVRHIFSDIQGFRYFLALINAHRSDKFKYLESIGPCSKESVDLHNTCAFLYKNTLTSLNLRENKKNYPECTLYDLLHEFPKVKRLYVDTGIHNFFETAENATVSLPSLKGMFFANMDTGSTRIMTAYKPIDISSVTPKTEVIDLIIQSISYENDNFLVYLITKFPSLKRILINQNKDAMVYSTILEKLRSEKNNFSVPVLSKFMAFVSKCQFYSMDLLYTTLYTHEILNSYWNLCNPKDMKFVSLTYEQEPFWPSYEEHPVNHNSLSHVRMSLDLLSKGKAIVFTYEPCNITFPHLQALENSGNKLDRLALTIGSRKLEDVLKGRDQSLINIVNGKHFSHAVENCTQLKSFHVYNSRIVLFTFAQDSFVNTSITTLTLERVVISKDALQKISIRLPMLNSLELKNILYIDEKVIEDATPTFNSVIDMPSTSFKYINVQDYLLDSVSDCKYPSKIFIKVTTKDSSKCFKYEMSDEMQSECDLSDDESDSEFEPTASHIKIFSRAHFLSENEYNDKLYDNTYANIHVKCKALNYMVLYLKKIHPDFGCSILMPNIAMGNELSLKSEEEIHAYFVQTTS